MPLFSSRHSGALNPVQVGGVLIVCLSFVIGQAQAHGPARLPHTPPTGPAKSIHWMHPEPTPAPAGVAVPAARTLVSCATAGPAKAQHWTGCPSAVGGAAPAPMPVVLDTRPEAGPAKALHWMGRHPQDR